MKKILLGLLFLASFASFGQQTDAQNSAQFNIIRNEQNPGANTRARVADAYEALNGSKVSRAELLTTTGTNDYKIQAHASIVDYSKPIQVLVRFANGNSGASTLNVNNIGPVAIKKNISQDLVGGDISAGQIAWLVYDGSVFQFLSLNGNGGSTFTGDITVSLSGGKTLGWVPNGSTIPSTGKTAEQVFRYISSEYQNPAWNSFTVSGTGIAATVETGTAMPATGTFTWSISQNSGTVLTIDLVDVTASTTLVAGTPNDGSQAGVSLTANTLNTNGASQSWRGVLHDTGGVTQDINSPLYTVTARFYRFYGPSASSVTNSATVRALASSAFQLAGAVFNLNTGTTQTKFIVCLPPGITIQSVIDLDAFNSDITSQYVAKTSINVLDAGGTNRAYNIYEMNIGVTYSTSHRHQITTN